MPSSKIGNKSHVLSARKGAVKGSNPAEINRAEERLQNYGEFCRQSAPKVLVFLAIDEHLGEFPDQF
jgi:hypothetical protein